MKRLLCATLWLWHSIRSVFAKTGLGQTQGKFFRPKAVSILQGYNQKNAQDYRCLNSTGGKKTALFAPFIYKNQHFTKTGSGRT
jgi:hypothetical protein